MANQKREWIIQQCVSAVANDYQDWPEYSKRLMTRDKMKAALTERSRKCASATATPATFNHQYQKH